MKNLIIGASLVTILFQCGEIRAVDDVTGQSTNVNIKLSQGSSAECLESWNLFFDKNPVDTIRGSLSDLEYARLTVRKILGLLVLRDVEASSPDFFNKVNFARFKKEVGPGSSLQELAIEMLFFDSDAVNNEMLRRLRSEIKLDMRESLSARISRNSALNKTLQSTSEAAHSPADGVLLEYVRMISCVDNAYASYSSGDFFPYIDSQGKARKKLYHKSFIAKKILDEIIPEIDYISFYQSVNNNKERLAQQLTSRKEVGLDEDEIARAILIIVNALFYSDINSDEDSYYTKFIKGLPGLRIGGWILPYAYESLLKISIAARVAALENGLGSEATARVKGVASTAFANEAAQRLDILDTEQSIRIIRRVSDRMEYISIIEKIRFEGQNSNGEVDDGNMQKYIKDFSGFLILLLQYQKDFVSNSIFWSDKKDESYVKDMVKKFLEKSAIKCFDQNILNKFCSTPAMAPIFWQYCMNNHQKIEIKGYAVVDYILKNGKASIFQFLQQINFEDMSNKEKIDLLYRMCQWALEIKEGSYTSLNSDVIQKILPSLPMSEILAIIGKPSFCAFPELVQGLKDNQLVDGVIAKELLDKVKSSESMGYNIMVAVASIYDRLQKIYDENCTSVNKNTLLEIAKELIWFGDALKYIPSDTANHIVRLREGGFTFGETNFLLQYVTDSKMIEKLIKQTNFNNRVLDLLIILNRNYLSSSLYSCTRSIIISTLAEKNEDGCLDVELGGRLLRVLPERFIPLILQKIDLKTNFQKITKILMNRFKNNWVSDNTESWEQRIYHNYQMVALLAEAANGQTMSSELEGFLFTRIDDTQLEYIHKNFVCSKEKLSPEAKNDSESKLTKSNFIYKVGRDVIPNGYKELLLKKLKTLQEVSKKRTFGFAHESLVAMLLDYIQEQDKRPFTLEEFTIFGIFLQSFSQDSRKNNLEQKLIEMYQQREIDLSNNSKTEASASATSKEFLENILKTAVEENNDSEWEYHYSNEIFGDSSSFSSPGRDSSSSSSSSISSPCFSSSSISSPRFSSSSRRQYRFSSPGRDSSSSSSSSSVSQEGTSSNLKVKNTQILVGEEYKSQPTGDLAISAALIDLNIENANTAWDSEVFGVSTTWENLPKIYGNKKRRAYYEPDSDDDSDSDGDGGYNNYCDEPRCSSPDPDWIMKTKGISPPPSGFSNNTLTRGAYSQRTAFPSCMNFGNPPYYGDDDNEDYDSRRRNYFPRDSVTPSPRRRQGRPSSPPPRSNLSLSESDISNFPWLKALERTLIDESNYLPPIDEDGELSPKILRIKGEKNLVRVEEEPIYSINTTKQYEIMGVPFYISSNGKARNFGRDVRCQVEGLPEEKRAEETLTIAYSKYFRPLENIYAKTAKESESCSLTKFVWGPDNIDVLLLINGERDYLRNCIGNEGKSGKSVSSSSDSSSSETNNESSSSNFSTTNFSTTIVTSISSGSSQTSAAPKRKHEKGPYDKMLLKPVHGYVKFQLNNKMKKSKEDEEYEEYEEYEE